MVGKKPLSIEGNLQDLFVFFLAVFLVVSLNPYYFWGREVYAIVFAFIPCLFLSIFQSGFKLEGFFSSFVISICAFGFTLMSGASLPAAALFSYVIFTVSMLPREQLVSLYLRFKFFYLLLLFPGLLIWSTHFLFGNHLFLVEVMDESINPKQGTGEGYHIYPFTVVLDYMLPDSPYRFMGPFDEPGVVGTVSALLLAAEGMKLKKITNLILILSGVVSFSLAFYVLIAVYLLGMSLVSFRYFMMCMISFGGLIVGSVASEYVAEKITSRLNIDGGQISGDNRAGYFLHDDFDRWASSDFFYVIFGRPDVTADGSSSWMQIPIQTGLFGFFLFFLFHFFAAQRYTKKYFSPESLVFVVCFFLSVYQRPDVIKPVYFLIFLVGIAGLQLSKETRRDCCV